MSRKGNLVINELTWEQIARNKLRHIMHDPTKHWEECSKLQNINLIASKSGRSKKYRIKKSSRELCGGRTIIKIVIEL